MQINKLTRSFKENPTTLYRGWLLKSVNVDGIDSPYIFYPAVHTKAVLIFFTGFNSSPLFYNEELKPLRKEGITSIGVPLPYCETNTDFLPFFKKLMQKIVFDKDSPAYNIIRPEVPRYLLTHSTSGMVFQYLMKTTENRENISHLLQRAMHMAMFLDTANSSKDFHNKASMVLKWYGKRNSNKTAEETHLGKLYYDSFGVGTENNDNISSSYSDATLGQILELKEQGNRITEYYKNNTHHNDNYKTLPEDFYIGTNDACACPLTTTAFEKTKRERTRTITFEGLGHNMWLEAPNRVGNQIIQTIQTDNAFYQNTIYNTTHQPETITPDNNSAPIFIPNL